MACDVQSSAIGAAVFEGLTPKELEAVKVYLLCQYANSSLQGGNYRITEVGDVRITQGGDDRIWS